MTNNKIKKTAQKMCNEFKNTKDDNALGMLFSADLRNVLDIAKTASRNWKELNVKLTEYLRDIKEYLEIQFKGQTEKPTLEYRTGDREGKIIISLHFHNTVLLRTVVCDQQF